MGPLTWTDGGLATTLQAEGLPSGSPVETWLDERPQAIAAAHRAFVEAGAGLVLAATFRALPGVDPRWERHVERALALARDAVAGRAEVWSPLGPAPVSWAESTHAGRAGWGAAWASAARRAAEAGARGIVLETFVEAAALAHATRSVRGAVPGLPVVACLVPDPDGRLVGGDDPASAVEALLAEGVAGVGFNCGWGPEGVERALDRCRGLDARWWAKPAAALRPEATVSALVRLAGRCAWVGGCCGVRPEVLAEASARARAPTAPFVPYSADPRGDRDG